MKRIASFELLRSVKLELPFKKSESPWFLLTGPHNIGNIPRGVRNAIDLAPAEVIPCPPPKSVPDFLENNFVTASASGAVIEAKDSVVKIRHKKGLVTGYMHLKNIGVKVGDKISPGDPLGNPSCDSPKGGFTTGIHLHFFVELIEKNGKIAVPVPIDGFKMGNWTVREGEKYGEGKMIKNGEQDRVADGRRCMPCGNIRNDIYLTPVPKRP